MGTRRDGAKPCGRWRLGVQLGDAHHLKATRPSRCSRFNICCSAVSGVCPAVSMRTTSVDHGSYCRCCTSSHVGRCRPSMSALRCSIRCRCSSRFVHTTSIHTQVAPCVAQHPSTLDEIGRLLTQSATTLLPRRRLSVAIRWLNRYPLPPHGGP